MSNLSKLAILAAGLGIGYIIEPNIFPRGENTTPSADTGKGASIDLDLSKLIPSDFPEKIELYKELSINDSASGVTMSLPKGSFVKPVGINGDKIVIQPVGVPIKSEINPDYTNFKQLTLPKFIERLRKGPAAAQATQEVTPPAPVAPTPAPVVENKTPVTPEPPAAPEFTGPLTDEQILSLMKDHIGSGKVREFTAEQITSAKIGKKETVEGVTYEQSGRVIFTAKTILGTQTHGAIALIENGKIVKWVWAKNMLEMR